MNTCEIVKDSIKYSFSNWKSFLILGLIIWFSGLGSIVVSLGIFLGILFIIGILIGFLVKGYELKIISSSLNGVNKLPEFNRWINLFINGIKVSIVRIVYFLPAILIIVILGVSSIDSVINNLYDLSSFNVGIFLNIWILIAFLYLVFITPIMLMAIANMANNNCKLIASFRFKEIINKITIKGWKNLIVWYLSLGIIYLILSIIGDFIINIFSISIHYIIGSLISSLIILPFLQTYLNRSIALFYNSDINGEPIE